MRGIGYALATLPAAVWMVVIYHDDGSEELVIGTVARWSAIVLATVAPNDTSYLVLAAIL